MVHVPLELSTSRAGMAHALTVPSWGKLRSGVVDTRKRNPVKGDPVEIDQARRRLQSSELTHRTVALEALTRAWHRGALECAPQGQAVNLHSHTFFSYNAHGHTPASLAWLARELGWYALGTVDFDVLDGALETLEALDRVQVRGAVGIETRVYVPHFANLETNSPGEPGIMYHIGVGFTGTEIPEEAAATLEGMRRRSGERNREMVARLNAHLSPVEIDYDGNVLALTPSGNATERHILLAYDAAARTHFLRRATLVSFWSDKLGLSSAIVDGFLGDVPAPHDAIRAKLMKRGGIGYVQPDADSYPRFVDANEMIIACGAIPLYGFVDGLSQGEQKLDQVLEYLVGQGIAGLNIVPDRNWNIADADERSLKQRRLHEVIELARSLGLPILTGTEMNKAGQPLIDDLSVPALRPYRPDFVRGADFVYGHTVLERVLGLGYQSEWAAVHLPERRDRNAFFVRVGRAVLPGIQARERLAELDPSHGPEALLAQLGA